MIISKNNNNYKNCKASNNTLIEILKYYTDKNNNTSYEFVEYMAQFPDIFLKDINDIPN